MDREKQERLIAESFIKPDKRNRFVELAKSRKIIKKEKLSNKEIKQRKKYSNMISNLEHWISPKSRHLVITALGNHSEIKKKLEMLDVPIDGYVMSYDLGIDGQYLSRNEVFSHLEKNNVYGTLIFFGSNGISYYEQCEYDGLTSIIFAIGHKNSKI